MKLMKLLWRHLKLFMRYGGVESKPRNSVDERWEIEEMRQLDDFGLLSNLELTIYTVVSNVPQMMVV